MMDAFDDDLVLRVAPFLRSRDLLSLSLSCRRFGHRHGAASARERRLAARNAKKRRAEAGAAPRTSHVTGWSLMEEAARTVLAGRRTREERERLPKRAGQTWIGLHFEWENYRTPPSFDQLFGVNARYASKGDFSEILLGDEPGRRPSTAISDQVMRSGRHYISFRCEGSELHEVSVGIMRPAKGLGKIIGTTLTQFCTFCTPEF